eukprot:g557.t1
MPKTKKKRKKRKRSSNDAETREKSGNRLKRVERACDDADDDVESLLSPELRAQLGGGGGDAMLVTSKKSRRKSKARNNRKERIDPAILKQMKKMEKRQQRKMMKIQERKDQLKNRKHLYANMHKNAISASTLALLHGSGRVGQKLTRKEQIHRDLRMQRANLPLPENSRLYQRIERDDHGDAPEVTDAMTSDDSHLDTKQSSSSLNDADDSLSKDAESDLTLEKLNMIRLGTKDVFGVGVGTFEQSRCSHWHLDVDRLALQSPCCLKFYACAECHDAMETHKLKPWKVTTSLHHQALLCGACGKTFSFAEYFKAPNACPHCAAGFNPKCKTHWTTYFSTDLLREANVAVDATDEKREATPVVDDVQDVSSERASDVVTREVCSTERPCTAPSLTQEDSNVASTPAFYNLVNRDPKIQAARLELPMCGMEQELMEAISENDVVIVCGETGSGKTTQVPQFFFEAGYGTNPKTPGIIAVTQPRRVAAISTAQRVAVELNTPCDASGLVAYQIRHMTSGVSDRTKIKFMTEGVLLQEAMHDVLLSRYSVIVLDEAHERNTDTDLLLGILSRVIPLRARRQAALAESSDSDARGEYVGPLKLVIMSATLRIEDFTENRRLFSSPPPVIRVGGRQHAVTVHFARKTSSDEEYLQRCVHKVFQIHRRLPHGSILVFLPGKREIDYVCKKLNRSKNRHKRVTPASKRAGDDADLAIGESSSSDDDNSVRRDGRVGASSVDEDAEEDEAETRVLGANLSETKTTTKCGKRKETGHEKEDDGETLVETDRVLTDIVDGPILALPLHAQLPKREQLRIFQPPPEGTRLVIVATNVAESSITIPGVRYVVDTGRVRSRTFGLNGMASVSQFTTHWCTKASADQRAGRAGRTASGHAYRLYSSAVFDNQFESFAAPEIVLNGDALASVVLRLKRLHIDCVSKFPFPTPPSRPAIRRAIKELADLGLLKSSTRSRKVDLDGDDPDGSLTPLGRSAAQFPVEPRYGKLLALAAVRSRSSVRSRDAFASVDATDGANINELAVALVASLSLQSSPFRTLLSAQAAAERVEHEKRESASTKADEATENVVSAEEQARKDAIDAERKLQMDLLQQWTHLRSDALAVLRVLGAASHVVASTSSKRRRTTILASWSREQRLVPRAVREMTQLRDQLRRQLRLRVKESWWSGASAQPPVLRPPSNRDESVLLQLLGASSLDKIARRVDGEGVAYQTCDDSVKERVYIHNRSFVKPRGGKRQSIGVDAQYVSYQELIRSTGHREIVTMRGVTVIDPRWLPRVAAGSPLLHSSGPLEDPPPFYDVKRDRLKCHVLYRYGPHLWKLPLQLESYPSTNAKRFAWFARLLLEGSVLGQFRALRNHYRSNTRELTMSSGGSSASRVVALVAPLRAEGVDCAEKLSSVWRRDSGFLRDALRKWVRKSERPRIKEMWPALMQWAEVSAPMT